MVTYWSYVGTRVEICHLDLLRADCGDRWVGCGTVVCVRSGCVLLLSLCLEFCVFQVYALSVYVVRVLVVRGWAAWVYCGGEEIGLVHYSLVYRW